VVECSAETAQGTAIVLRHTSLLEHRTRGTFERNEQM